MRRAPRLGRFACVNAHRSTRAVRLHYACHFVKYYARSCTVICQHPFQMYRRVLFTKIKRIIIELNFICKIVVVRRRSGSHSEPINYLIHTRYASTPGPAATTDIIFYDSLSKKHNTHTHRLMFRFIGHRSAQHTVRERVSERIDDRRRPCRFCVSCSRRIYATYLNKLSVLLYAAATSWDRHFTTTTTTT